MPEYYIHPFWLLGVAQVTIFLAVAAVYFWYRSISTAQHEVVEKKEAKESFSTYIAYLDNELDIADNLPEQEEMDENQDTMMELRRGFLDIERVTNTLGSDTQEFQKQYAKSLQGLINQYIQDAAGTGQPQSIDLSDDIELAENTSDKDENRNTIDTYEKEFKSLKEIIKNQHDAMKALREQLEKKGDDEGINEINDILKQVEQEHLEIGSSIDRLDVSSEEESNADDGDLLLDEGNESVLSMEEISGIVSGQQSNIHQLRELITNLGNEHEETFESSVVNIERANSDLSSCLTYLADENDDLRTKLKDTKESMDDSTANEESA